MTTDPRPTPEFPNRPDHPDFAWLSRAIQAQDARTEHPGFRVRDALAMLPIDPDSLTYLATERAKMIVGHIADQGMLRGLPMSSRMSLRAAIGAVYLDAFTLGVQYGREVAEDGR